MAEAHSAVAFSFAITHEGWDVNFDREILNIVWASGVRSWKKRLARFKVDRNFGNPFSNANCFLFSIMWGLVRNPMPDVYPMNIFNYLIKCLTQKFPIKWFFKTCPVCFLYTQFQFNIYIVFAE